MACPVVDPEQLDVHSTVERGHETPKYNSRNHRGAHCGASVLNEKSFVPVLLPACTLLLERHSGHRLYCFLAVSAGARPRGRHGQVLCEWLMLPRHKISEAFCGWSKEDEATIDGWLAADGFRAFMLPSQRARFKNPVVDCIDGKLVIRSGKKKITPLNT